MSPSAYPKIDVPGLGPTDIRPTGKFARHITEAVSELMVASTAKPLDEMVTLISDDNPTLSDEKVYELAVQRRSDEWSRQTTEAVARIMGKDNLMYVLAADAIHQEFEWAEDNLSPRLAAEIVKKAMAVGEVRAYLGECLTLLYTAAPTPEQSTPADTPDESGSDSPVSSAGSQDSVQKTSMSATLERS